MVVEPPFAASPVGDAANRIFQDDPTGTVKVVSRDSTWVAMPAGMLLGVKVMGGQEEEWQTDEVGENVGDDVFMAASIPMEAVEPSGTRISALTAVT